MSDSSVKVSIGVPVKNAEEWIDESLKQLVNQTHKNIEIIISDNNSSDGTDEICRRYQESDERVHYFRHDDSLSALNNFRYVFEKASGKYFMWAAHDDRHSLNYVEKLVESLESNPDASLAFSDVAIFHDSKEWKNACCKKYNFECDGKDRFWRGLMSRDYIRAGYLHIYGLIRKKCLEEYTWPDIEIGSDRPILLYLWRKGRFISASGACFYCFKPRVKKTNKYRAAYVSGKDIKPFPYIRLSWICASVAYKAERGEDRYHNRYIIFIVLMLKEAKIQSYRRLYSFGSTLFRKALTRV